MMAFFLSSHLPLVIIVISVIICFYFLSYEHHWMVLPLLDLEMRILIPSVPSLIPGYHVRNTWVTVQTSKYYRINRLF